MVLLSDLYDITLKRPLRGQATAGFVRPTIGEFFVTHKDFTQIPKAAQGGGTTFLGYGNNLATEGSNVSASTYHGTRLPEHVVNGGTTQTDTDGWSSNGSELGANDPWIMYDFGAGNGKIIGKMSFIGYTNGNDVRDFVLEASNDNSSWTSLLTDVGYNGATEYVKEFSNTTAYRYYRVRVTSHWYGDGWCGMVDWKLYEALYGLKYTSDLCTVPANGFASASQSATRQPEEAFLDNPGDHDNSWSGPNVPQWIGYNFGTPTQIEKYTLQMPNQSAEFYSPLDWTFEGSNGGEWTVLHTVANAAAWNQSEKREFEFVNNGTYTQYRINTSRTASLAYVIIDEIEMMEVNPYTEDLCVGGTATCDAGTNNPGLAFDNTIANRQTSNWTCHTPLGAGVHWLQYAFTGTEKVTKLRIYCHQHTSGWYGITDFRLVASNTGAFSGEEVLLLDDTCANQADWNEFIFSNANAYKYYRIIIDDYVSTGNFHIDEVEMLYKYR